MDKQLTESEILELQKENKILKKILKSYYNDQNFKLFTILKDYKFINKDFIVNILGMTPEEVKASESLEHIHDNLVVWLKTFQNYVYNQSVSKGWWGDDTNDGAICARIHGEVSELMEALRYDNPRSDHIEMSLCEEEIADIILMALEFANYKNWDVCKALLEKTKFNANRPYRHGKKF